MNVKHPILVCYFEDILKDAIHFAEGVARIYEVEGPAPTAKDAQVREFLEQYGIRWFTQFEQVMQSVKEYNGYSLFILDIMIESDSLNCLNLIEKIRENKEHAGSDIWVLSSFTHFEERALKTLKANKFFSKSKMDEMLPALKERLLGGEDRRRLHQPYFVLQEGKRTVTIEAKDVIYIESADRKINVYLFDRNQMVPRIEEFYANLGALTSIMNQAAEQALDHFLMIGKGCLVNINMVTETRKENGVYYLKLRRIPKYLSIGRSYRTQAEEIFGRKAFE